MKLVPIRIQKSIAVTVWVSECGYWRVTELNDIGMIEVQCAGFSALGKTIKEAAAKLIIDGENMQGDGKDLSYHTRRDFKLEGVALGSLLNPPGIIGVKGPPGPGFWHELYEATDGLKNIAEEKEV